MPRTALGRRVLRRRRLPPLVLVAPVVTATGVLAVGALDTPATHPTQVRTRIHEVAPPTRAAGRGSVQKLMVRAEDAPGGARQVLVYRPAVPDSADLPVVYFLHGLPGSASDLLRLGASDVVDRLVGSRRVQPFVLVFPDGAVRGGLDSEWTDSANHAVRLESFVTDAVVAAVEGSHRRDRAHRALAGFSMGGYGATEIALRHPDLYGQVVSLAGYFHVDDPDHMFGDDPAIRAAHDPGRQLEGARAFRLLLLDGAQDSDPVTTGETVRYAALLRAEGIAVTSAVTPGVHSTQWALGQLPLVASFLDAGWRVAPTREPARRSRSLRAT